MKIKNIALSAAALLFCAIMCGCSVASNTSKTNSNAIESSFSQSSETFKEPIELNEEKFAEYIYRLANFVNSPIETPEDIKNLDIFYLLVVTAEQYAQSKSETYSVDGEGSMHHFPVKDLQNLAAKLFNTEIDLSSYLDNTYFNQVGRISDSYDEATNTFNIVFAAKFYPVSENNESIDCYEISSITTKESETTVKCKLGFSHGLGSTATYFDATYVFEVFEENNLLYYQLKSLSTNRAS